MPLSLIGGAAAWSVRASILGDVSFLRGIDGDAHNATGTPARWVRPGDHRRRDARTAQLCEATLACARCDAPIAAGADGLSLTEPLVCPFCDHRAPVRDFLSLALPTRPARVVVRISHPG
jgi:DNA-directed RNA polymerase subunit RPC12/RpoP